MSLRIHFPAGSVVAAAAVATLGSLAAHSAVAFAGVPTVRYQTGFETSESYTVGPLGGQNNWSQFDADAPFPDATIQNTNVRALTGGAQAVKIQANGAALDPFSDFTDVFSTDTGVGAATIINEPLVTIQFDMMRGTLDGGELPTAAWGIDIYDSTDSAIAATVVAYDDQLGPAVGGTDETGGFAFLGDASARGTWDTYRIEMNYLTRDYTVWLNGVQLGNTLPLNAAADGGIGDVDFLALSRGTDAAYFDNLLITTQSVPEPTAIVALSCVAIGTLVSRRFRAREHKVAIPLADLPCGRFRDEVANPRVATSNRRLA